MRTTHNPHYIVNNSNMSSFTSVIQYHIGNYSSCSETRKINNMYVYWKGSSKADFICKWHDCLCRKPQNNLQKTLLELLRVVKLQYTMSLYTSQLHSCLQARNNWNLKIIKKNKLSFLIAPKLF